jgi:zinc-ribbon domain
MLCPRCNTELPDSATVCSQCGSPVFATAPMQTEAAAFSYLPAGAPGWPATASPQLPATLAVQTQRVPVGTPPGLRDNERWEQERPERKPGSLGVPIVLLLLFASILVSGGLTYGVLTLQKLNNGLQPPSRAISIPPAATPGAQTPTPGAVSPTPGTTGGQLPTPASFKPGVSPDLGITMQFPSDWIQDKTQQGSNGNKDIIFHPSSNQLPVSLIILQISAANSAKATNTSEINQANIQGFGSAYSLPNPQILTNTPTTRSVGGVTWDEEDAVFSPSGGESIHVATLSVKHKAYYFNILFFAPASAWDEAMAKYYSKMLDSFQFTS